MCQPSSQTTLFIAQADRLKAGGVILKNTFLEIPSAPQCLVARRSRSQPAALVSRQASDESSHDESPATSVQRRHSDYAPFSTSQASWPCANKAEQLLEDTPLSCVSTACSEVDMQSELEAEETINFGEEFEKAIAQLASIVEEACAFLRIQGHSLHTDLVASRRRSAASAPVATLRFFVRGLPWAKRARWVQPLLWSVVPSLQKRGVMVNMKGGDLTATLNGGTQVVRLDFSSARFC